MFERFTASAREAVTGAQAAARELRDRHIGTEHVLLSMVAGDDAAARTLRAHGLTADDLRARIARVNRTGGDVLDSEALRSIGIDLDAVRDATEQSFGEGALDVPAGKLHRYRGGHIPFTPKAKKALELSLRHAIRLKQKRIASGHILLGILHDDDFLSARLAAEAGVDVPALRADIERLLTSEAA
ncbi:Clp amino terminal domain-containing protein, pathogenicity island component [Actinomadura meyerae]|jgi:ATP-dependent Clp protease ATP-binding subunit ClpA|uniref:Clp amino terminal domain-containing protein, pathogenicity island component n=1 Tax=Actinomadura meyerae TaxID=240840 RepID=A0A239MYV0_9ACTN|nr:Clp protease N-terminal domain-containing protein [Actinomadura meyerae]SNT47403.1 Clp amino terminal domain-containing protein, pathogenicity island component [Actinomadura meyerae]